MPKTRILIADNSRDFVYLMVQFFSNCCELEIIGVAYDGKQALEMIEQTKPDVLLLDMIMPGMDGMEVLKNLQQKTDALRIIVISAIDISQLIKNELRLKIDQYFTKPVVLNDISKAILDGVIKADNSRHSLGAGTY